MEANLKRRLSTALVIIPLLVIIVGWGSPWFFTAFILLVTAVALFEFFTMALPGYVMGQILGVVFGVAVSLVVVVPQVRHQELWLSILLVLCFSGFLFCSGKLNDKFTRVASTLLGGFYLGLLMPNWIFLFRFANGRNWVFFVLAVIMAGDATAYFAGRRFGVRKLAPEISPAKTRAGAWGYMLGSVVVGILAASWLVADYPMVEVVALTLILAVSGQVGDLFESLLKRVFGVKDSSSLIPGHGGVLDRLDSLIFPAVFANAYLRVFHP